MSRHWFIPGLALVLTVFALNPAVLAEESDLILPEQYLVITATRLPTSLEETGATVVTITRQEIETSGAATVGEALAQATVPGLSLSDYGGGGVSQIHLRGNGADRILVLVDGRPVNPPQGGGADLGLIPTANVERIEIVSGADSAAWGADAAGGVMNIITRRGAAKPSLSLETGSFDTWRLQGTTPLNLAGGTGLLTLDTGTSGGFRPNSDYTRGSLSTRLTWEMDNQTLVSAYAAGTVKETGVPGSLTYLSPNDRQCDQALTLEFSGSRVLDGEGRVLAGKVWADQSLRWYDSSFGHNRHDTKTLGLEGNYRLNSAPDRQRLLGLELRGASLNSTSFEFTPAMATWALLWEEALTRPRYTLNLGGRLDGHSAYGEQFSPRLGGVFHLTPGLDLKGAVGRGFHAPSFNDLYYNDSFSEGDPNLRPETTWSGEIGLAHQGSRVQSGVTGFYRVSWDQIRWLPDPDKYRVRNLPPGSVAGLELSLSTPLGSGLQADLTYSRMESRDFSTGRELTYTPEQQAGLSLTWTNPVLQGRLGGRFVSPQWHDPDNTIQVPAHWVVDLNLRGNMIPNLGWFLRVENLLDQAYQEVYDYPMPQRSISAGLNLSF